MDKPKQPTKEAVKHWLDDRAAHRKPLPDTKTIRRELGMDLIDAERDAKLRTDLAK
ncbi:MAG: hypothetical protein JO269_09565 [Burkholderiaceae bacterium]|nr:hypothetical protein [Burkholderiaceae bacterium]